MKYITHPKTGERFLLMSRSGKHLLKQLISSFNAIKHGGQTTSLQFTITPKGHQFRSQNTLSGGTVIVDELVTDNNKQQLVNTIQGLVDKGYVTVTGNQGDDLKEELNAIKANDWNVKFKKVVQLAMSIAHFQNEIAASNLEIECFFIHLSSLFNSLNLKKYFGKFL